MQALSSLPPSPLIRYRTKNTLLKEKIVGAAGENKKYLIKGENFEKF